MTVKNWRVVMLKKKAGRRWYYIDIEAPTRKAALEIARERWQRFTSAHAFGVDIARIPEELVVSWSDWFTGVDKDCFDHSDERDFVNGIIGWNIA